MDSNSEVSKHIYMKPGVLSMMRGLGEIGLIRLRQEF